MREPQVPFYRDQGRLDPLFTLNDEIDWSRWTEIPVLTRAEAQRNEQALYADTVPPECGEVIPGYTAGSTGTPLAYRVNFLIAAAASAVLERALAWAGLPADVSLATLRNDRKGECPYPAGLTYQTTIRGATRMLHYLAVQTPMFICEETIHVEFRQPNDFSNVGDGLVELIFTPLYNYAMPLIRYACGDFTVPDTNPAPDNRTLRRLERIVGRERNFFVFPSGRRWWPTYQNKVLCDFLDYKQIQFAQTHHDRVEIRFVSDLAEPIRDAEGLQRLRHRSAGRIEERAVRRKTPWRQRLTFRRTSHRGLQTWH